MLAVDELKYTLNRLEVLHNNVDDEIERRWSEICLANLKNLISGLEQAIAQQVPEK